MENNALIGFSGFIGKNLSEQMEFKNLYNSKNIHEIRGKEFDLVISCGNSAVKWLVNKNPEEDIKNIQSFMDHLSEVKTKKFVLISTIDVYEDPIDVNENEEPFCSENKPYGRHRLILENFIKNKFTDHLIIRLPIVYGKYFKKNLIYDVIHNNETWKINGSNFIQIYNVKNLVKDIDYFFNKSLSVVNLSTEPVNVRELFSKVFKIEQPENENAQKTNMESIYAPNGSYFYDKFAIINELKEFVDVYEIECI